MKPIRTTRRDYYQGWDGICCVCGHDYISQCQGNCTCLACNAQRQFEEKEGLEFEDTVTPPPIQATNVSLEVRGLMATAATVSLATHSWWKSKRRCEDETAIYFNVAWVIESTEAP